MRYTDEVEREMNEYRDNEPNDLTPEEQEQQHQAMLFEMWKDQQDMEESYQQRMQDEAEGGEELGVGGEGIPF